MKLPVQTSAVIRGALHWPMPRLSQGVILAEYFWFEPQAESVTCTQKICSCGGGLYACCPTSDHCTSSGGMCKCG